MIRLLTADLLRIRRYWLPWSILAVLVLILILQVNSKLNQLTDLETQIALGTYESESEELGTVPLEANLYMLEELKQDLVYPTFIGTVTRLSTGVGWFLIIILTAVICGEDFSLRTLSNTLSRGIGRAQYLASRCLSLWFMAGLAILVVVLLAMVVGPFVHNQITSDPISLQGIGETFFLVIRTWLTYLPFIIATLFWVVLARNAGPALGVGIGLHTFELLNGLVIPFIAVVFGNISGSEIPWFYRVQIYLFSFSLGYNANVFLSWGAPFLQDPLFVAKTMGLSDTSLLPSTPLRSGIILIAHAVIFLVWTMRILQRRDMTYGS